MRTVGDSGTAPRLRFPEFRNRAGWAVRATGTIAEVHQGYAFPERFQGSAEGEYPFYKVSDISATVDRGDRLIDTARNYVSGEVLRTLRAKPIPAGTTIFAKIGEAIRSDKRALTSKPSLIDNNIAGLKGFPDQVSDLFLFYLWSQVSLADYSGGVVPSVNKSVIEVVPVMCPRLDEQQRVTDCLESLDDVIAAQAQKVEALKAHKRGLMQQLFPRDGETVPRLRFPEFRDAPGWETHRLADFISALDAGVSVNSGDRPAKSIECGVLKTSAVSEGVFDVSENKVVLAASERDRARESVRADTIIISRMNTPALVGANAYVERDSPNIFLPDRLWAAKGNGRGDMRYLSYLLGSPKGRSALSRRATGTSGSMKNISKSAVLELEAMAPGLREQTQVADCLASLDVQILAAAEKLNYLRQHKHGLMRQLFPEAEARP